MTITGLENNYYLSGNDIWVGVGNFAQPVAVLEITAKNLTTGALLPAFKLSASPANDFQFNISQIIRALFPEPNHISNNNLQNFQIDFKAIFTSEAPDETQSLIRFFVRGGRHKNGNDEWHLNSSYELLVGPWIEWAGITLPGYPQRIMGDWIVDYIAVNYYRHSVPNNCDYKVVKFLNSLGGYQYYVFERYEIKTKNRPGKTISKITNRLSQDNFRKLGNEVEVSLKLFSKTPAEMQKVIIDLIKSFEVYLFNPSGTDADSRWERLMPESNDVVEDNFNLVFHNEIEFTFSNYVTNGI